jgi:hypothetical protein
MNKTQMTNSTGTLYYVGDIGYAMTKDEWNDAMELYMDDFYAPFYTFKDGRQFTLCDIGYGDVGNVGADGWNYTSDSGLIGIMRANQIDRECMPTLQAVMKQNGLQFLRIDAPTVQAVIESGLSPLGETVYTEDDFVVIDEII